MVRLSGTEHASPMAIKRCDITCFLWFYGLCLAAQLGGAYFTAMGVNDWYLTLEKSPLNPPGPVFGIVWSILYILMALAACRVYDCHKHYNNRPLRWWFVQLLLGFIWCVMFFGHQAILSGLIIICCTTLATIVTTVLFWRHDDLSGILMLPLVLWLTLATHLNLFIYLNN